MLCPVNQSAHQSTQMKDVPIGPSYSGSGVGAQRQRERELLPSPFFCCLSTLLLSFWIPHPFSLPQSPHPNILSTPFTCSSSLLLHLVKSYKQGIPSRVTNKPVTSPERASNKCSEATTQVTRGRRLVAAVPLWVPQTRNETLESHLPLLHNSSLRLQTLVSLLLNWRERDRCERTMPSARNLTKS